MIIDMHNHIGLSRDGGHGRLEELLANMATCGITKCVIFAMDEKDRGETFENPNQRIIEAQRQFPEKLLAFARLVPSKRSVVMDEFQRCSRAGIKGIKLKASDGFDPPQAKVILDLIKKRRKFPVIIHTSHDEHSQPRLWESVIADYPEVNFILAHGAKDHYRKCTEFAVKYKNVYIDTSTLSLNRTRYIYEKAGAQKIVFASDYPYSHPAIELKKFEVLVKNKEDLKRILYKNALGLLNIKR